MEKIDSVLLEKYDIPEKYILDTYGTPVVKKEVPETLDQPVGGPAPKGKSFRGKKPAAKYYNKS
jgi:hypothetical protein